VASPTWLLHVAVAIQAADRGLREVALGGSRGGERIAAVRARIAPIVGRLVARAQAEGALRADIRTSDTPMIQMMVLGLADAASALAPELWRRYLAIVLDGLRAGGGPPSLLPVEALPLEQAQAVLQTAFTRRR